MSASATALPGSTRNEDRANPSQEDIANLAYALWQQLGTPAEQNWIEAERQLGEQQVIVSAQPVAAKTR